MKRPIISVVIPTYNRAHCLRNCLDSVVGQFKDPEVESEIEVVISDNGSTDNTTEVVQEYLALFPAIRYFRNDQNIGFDRNFLSGVDKSTGEYCISIGDDDAFFPGSFSYLLNKIKTLGLSYYMLNAWGYDHELKHPVVSHPNRQISEDRIYEDLREFVRSIDNYTDLVGNFGGMTHLFLRDTWQNFEEKTKYIGTQTIHLHIMLSVFKDTRCALLAKPIIKTRNDNMRWDTFPGLETSIARGKRTAEGVMWISNLYDLKLSPLKVKMYFLIRVYWISFKELIKKIIRR